MEENDYSLAPTNKSSNASIMAIDFSQGNNSLIEAIQKQYPQLDNTEIAVLGNVILDEVSKRIGDGQPIAFLEEENGKPVLNFLRVEIEDNITKIFLPGSGNEDS